VRGSRQATAAAHLRFRNVPVQLGTLLDTLLDTLLPLLPLLPLLLLPPLVMLRVTHGLQAGRRQRRRQRRRGGGAQGGPSKHRLTSLPRLHTLGPLMHRSPGPIADREPQHTALAAKVQTARAGQQVPT
jgi:hypothetical protein